jgi:hypothetical protein
MIVLNDYFHNEKKASNGSISVSGKLEDNVDNYLMIRPSGLIIIKHEESAV